MDSLPDNAATYLRQALTAVPELDWPEIHLLQQARTAPLTESAIRQLETLEPIFQTWVASISAPRCDWGFPTTPEGFEQLTALFGRSSLLIGLIGIRVRILVSQGDVEQAVRYIVGAFITARRFGGEHMFIAKIVQWAMESQIIDVTAGQLLQLDEAHCRSLASQLVQLPDSGNLKQSCLREKVFIEQQMYDDEKPKTIEEYEKELHFMCSAEEAQSIVRFAGGDTKKLAELGRRMAKYCEPLSDIMMLPFADFEKAIETFRVENQHANPMVINLARSSFAVRAAEMRSLVKLAQFRAALALRCDDQGEFDNIHDPYTDKSFPVRRFRGGFELSSPYRRLHQQRLIMTIGQESGLSGVFWRWWRSFGI